MTKLEEIEECGANTSNCPVDHEWLINRVKKLEEALNNECICRTNPFLVAARMAEEKRPRTCPACKALEEE